MARCSQCNGSGRTIDWYNEKLWLDVGGNLYIGPVTNCSESLEIGSFSSFNNNAIIKLSEIFQAGQKALQKTK